MKKTVILTLLLGFGTGLAGCRSKPDLSWYETAWPNASGWRGFSFQEAQEYLEGHQQVMMVCITQDHVEDVDPSKENSWSVYSFSGTVVRTYKGEWKVGERIQFTHALDSRVKQEENRKVGELLFLYTDVYSPNRFNIETGGFERYSVRTSRLLSAVFPQPSDSLSKAE